MAFKVKKNKGWKKIGNVAVDSGMLLLGDPAYAESFDYDKDVLTVDLNHKDYFPLKARKGLGTWKGEGRGVITQAGYGDGIYPVYAKVENTDWGKRVTQVKVEFISPEEVAKAQKMKPYLK